MTEDAKVFIGRGRKPATLSLEAASRHGLICGRTDSGRCSLQVITEGFSRAGVPVFVTDITGKLAGIAERGEATDWATKRAQNVGLSFEPDQFTTIFWDIFGEQGHPLRATITEMGPLLLSWLLDLTDEQEGVMNVAFRVADENGLTLIDLKDLQALLDAITPHDWSSADPLAQLRAMAQKVGRVSRQTVEAIQRQLTVLVENGGSKFFGEPALAPTDFMRTDSIGRGVVNVLVADKLMQNPRLYATFLLWLLAELAFEPETISSRKPSLIFLVDDAHLLFDGAPEELINKVTEIVGLLRSRAIGLYLATSNPLEVPDRILGLLGHLMQHAIRTSTRNDKEWIDRVVREFRPDTNIDVAQTIPQLSDDEALVSFLETDGTSRETDRIIVRPPAARIGPITRAERRNAIDGSSMKGRYEVAVDYESAYELISRRIAASADLPEVAPPISRPPDSGGLLSTLGAVLADIFGRSRANTPTANQLRNEGIRDMLELERRGTQIKFRYGELSSIGFNLDAELLCYVPATLVEARAIRHWQGAHAGPSFRVAKGLSFRIGASRGVSESHDEMRPVDQGTLVLTDKAILFLGSKRTLNLSIDDLISIDDDGYWNWLRINSSSRQKAVAFEFDGALQIQYPYDGETRSAPFHGAWLKSAINQVLLFKRHPEQRSSPLDAIGNNKVDEPKPIVRCIACRSTNILEEAAKGRSFVCKECGTTLEQVTDKYKLVRVADTGSVPQRYVGKVLFRREWSNIANGGLADDERVD